MTLTYQEVSRILSIIDTAPNKDLDITMEGVRTVVTTWHQNSQSINSSDDQNQLSEVLIEQLPTLQPVFHEVSSKQLGYFQLSPEVKIGSQVQKNDLIGAISVLGNDSAKQNVESPIDGWISDICLNDRDFVEYGQTLFVLSTNDV
jgi:biotin carboxyl carrier protein